MNSMARRFWGLDRNRRHLGIGPWVRVAELSSDTLTTRKRSAQASAISARRVETPGHAWPGGSMRSTRARPALPETHRSVPPHIRIPTNPQSLDPGITPSWKYDDPQNRHPAFPQKRRPASPQKRLSAEAHSSLHAVDE